MSDLTEQQRLNKAMVKEDQEELDTLDNAIEHARISSIWAWFWAPAHFNDRRIQACGVIVFCMAMIIWSFASAGHGGVVSVISERVVDWSFICMMSVTGVYHVARAVDEQLGRRFNPEIVRAIDHEDHMRRPVSER